MQKFSISMIVFLCTSFVLFTPQPSNASPEIKVAFVDLEKALAATEAGVQAQKKYEEEVKDTQKKLEEKKSEFEKLKDSFSKQRNSLNQAARTQKEDELLAKEKDLKRMIEDAQESLRRKNAQLVGELVGKMRKVVAQYGKDQGYTVILERGDQSLLYADNNIDITQDVVSKFNDQN